MPAEVEITTNGSAFEPAESGIIENMNMKRTWKVFRNTYNLFN